VTAMAVAVEYLARMAEDGRIHDFLKSDLEDRRDGFVIPRCQANEDYPRRMDVAELSGDLPNLRGSYRTCRGCMGLDRRARQP
jgi:hypothetical protein